MVPIPNLIVGNFPSKRMVASKVPNPTSEFPMIFAFKGEKKDVNNPDKERMTEKEGRRYFWSFIYKQEISSPYTRGFTGMNLYVIP